jgi:hypothetical protein
MDFSQFFTAITEAFTKALSRVQPYNIAPASYVTNNQVILPPKTNGWTVLNSGTTVAFVNNIPIPVGSFIAVSGNEREEYFGRVDIRFAAPAAAGNLVWFIPKFFATGELYDTFGK